MSTRPPPPAKFVSFLLEQAPDGALEALFAGAAAGDPRWRTFLASELATAIADSPALQAKFFAALIDETTPPPYCADVIDAYLSALSAPQRTRLFDPKAALKKRHPARLTYSAAALAPKGANQALLCSVLATFIGHGLAGALLIQLVRRCPWETTRAVMVGNRMFLKTIEPAIKDLPDDLLIGIVQSRSGNVSAAINMLVDDFHLPISRFVKPKVLDAAPSCVQHLIVHKAQHGQPPGLATPRKRRR